MAYCICSNHIDKTQGKRSISNIDLNCTGVCCLREMQRKRDKSERRRGVGAMVVDKAFHYKGESRRAWRVFFLDVLVHVDD